jgi:hypothetical protein
MSTETITGTSAISTDAIKARAASSSEPAFLTDRRLRALDHYLKTPMPGRTDEVWRREL